MNKYKLVAYLPGDRLCLARDSKGSLGFVWAVRPDENFKERPEWQLHSALSKYGYLPVTPEVELEYSAIGPYLDSLPIPEDESASP